MMMKKSTNNDRKFYQKNIDGKCVLKSPAYQIPEFYSFNEAREKSRYSNIEFTDINNIMIDSPRSIYENNILIYMKNDNIIMDMWLDKLFDSINTTKSSKKVNIFSRILTKFRNIKKK